MVTQQLVKVIRPHGMLKLGPCNWENWRDRTGLGVCQSLNALSFLFYFRENIHSSIHPFIHPFLYHLLEVWLQLEGSCQISWLNEQNCSSVYLSALITRSRVQLIWIQDLCERYLRMYTDEAKGRRYWPGSQRKSHILHVSCQCHIRDMSYC